MDNLVLTPAEPDAPHEHSYTEVVTAPTCTENGYTTYTCECGDTYQDNMTEATGHAFENGTCGVCGAADPDYQPETPEEPDQYVYEFDTMEFVTKPHWSEIPFAHGALPEGVTDKKGIYATIPLDTETVMTFTVAKDGTYAITFNGVTDTNGPTLQFFIDDVAIGNKVNMANGGGGWTFASFDLGKMTLTAGVHTLTIRGVDIDSNSACVMDNLVLTPTM